MPNIPHADHMCPGVRRRANIRFFSMTTVLFCMVAISGCNTAEDDPLDYDHRYISTLDLLNRLLARQVEARERAEAGHDVKWDMFDDWVEDGFRRAVELLETQALTEKPVALYAIVGRSSAATGWTLALSGLDRDGNVEGALILERHRISGELRAEKYPVFTDTHRSRMVMDVVVVPDVLPRENGQPTKDNSLWDAFHSSTRLHMPPICMSLPSEEIEVFLALYDQAGNIGPFVPVHLYVYGTQEAGE
jgi:hypothetical protein